MKKKVYGITYAYIYGLSNSPTKVGDYKKWEIQFKSNRDFPLPCDDNLSIHVYDSFANDTIAKYKSSFNRCFINIIH